MARPSANIPGFIGEFGKGPTPIGMTVPYKWRDYVETLLKEQGSDLSFQEAMKLALLSFFPVPGYEEITAKYIETLLPSKDRAETPKHHYIAGISSVPTIDTKEAVTLRKPNLPKMSKKIRSDEDIKEVQNQRNIERLTNTTPVDKKFVIPSSRETTEFLGDQFDHSGYVHISSSQREVLLTIYSKSEVPILQHKWDRKEFFETLAFYNEQARALIAVYKNQLEKFDKEKLDAAIVDALESQFDPNPRDDEEPYDAFPED